MVGISGTYKSSAKQNKVTKGVIIAISVVAQGLCILVILAIKFVNKRLCPWEDDDLMV